MRIIIAVLGLVTMVYAQFNDPYYNPNYYGARIPILRQHQNVAPDGSYSFGYETGNGISVAEQGTPKNVGGAQQAEDVRGQYSYTAPDGTQIRTDYVADENGFRATGAHLPTPPPIPLAIQRSLAYNAAHPQEDESGQYYNRRY